MVAHRISAGRLAAIGYLIFSIAIAWAFGAIDQSRRQATEQVNAINAAQCASLQNLYGVIRKTILDSERAIDTIAYYQMHPKEREAAHMRNQDTLSLFETPPCPRDIQVP